MSRILVFFLSLHFCLYGSAVPNFEDMSQCENVVFFLSTPQSGSNLVSGNLGIITRKPISWIRWGMKIFDPTSQHRNHPSYNRIGLRLISDTPLLYRTHYVSDLNEVSSQKNKLIFVSRNPKELLFREFYLNAQPAELPSNEFIDDFLTKYLNNFHVYISWDAKNKYLVFYEDVIDQETEQLVKILEFIGEEPTYLEDFITNKEEYLAQQLESYKTQHARVKGGASAKDGPKTIYYSKNVPKNILTYIDDYIKKDAPRIWEQCLKRFQTH